MDLTGRRFGRLVVTGEVRRNGILYAVCTCDCGNKVIVRNGSLTKKFSPTRSCGCYQREVVRRVGRETIMRNSYENKQMNAMFKTNFQTIESDHPPRNNTSGHKGVSVDKRSNKYVAYLYLHRKKISLGTYATYDEAVKAREAAEEEYFSPLVSAKNNVMERT